MMHVVLFNDPPGEETAEGIAFMWPEDHFKLNPTTWFVYDKAMEPSDIAKAIGINEETGFVGLVFPLRRPLSGWNYRDVWEFIQSRADG
jgi:hypothetical protein